MGVVRPDHDLGAEVGLLQVMHELKERLHHVAVTQVPRGDLVVDHRPVVLLGIVDEPGILIRVEELVGRLRPVAPDVGLPAPVEFHQDRCHLLLAILRHPGTRQQAVALGVVVIMIEAGVVLGDAACGGGIDLPERLDHRPSRGVEAVEIETVEADRHAGAGHSLALVVGDRVVPAPEPSDEIEHIRVPPHPLREAEESPERLHGFGIVSCSPDIGIDAVSVGPVGLHRDRVESLLPDQPFRDLGPHPVELMRPVRGLAEQDDLLSLGTLHHRVEIARSSRQGKCRPTDHGGVGSHG